jgi:hypothetical protein
MMVIDERRDAKGVAPPSAGRRLLRRYDDSGPVAAGARRLRHPMSETLEHVIYDLARSALEQQGEQVAELRGRAGTLIAGAALSNSVFAALAIDSVTGLGGWEIAGAARGPCRGHRVARRRPRVLGHRACGLDFMAWPTSHPRLLRARRRSRRCPTP